MEYKNFEHKGYEANLKKNHKKNNLYYTIKFVDINE